MLSSVSEIDNLKADIEIARTGQCFNIAHVLSIIYFF